jgi:hypothetical protein
MHPLSKNYILKYLNTSEKISWYTPRHFLSTHKVLHGKDFGAQIAIYLTFSFVGFTHVTKIQPPQSFMGEYRMFGCASLNIYPNFLIYYNVFKT